MIIELGSLVITANGGKYKNKGNANNMREKM